ncbi:hypothetical protein DGG96_09470 [Legionella qingyii]|uniref:Uncharacterized protein n=1 Tax=Legionella qingyii TaxID=2184757 RepID=A0A317U1N5_9GAMM|nr:hypothetical protein DGG96_09470 [Legionella qingyii]
MNNILVVVVKRGIAEIADFAQQDVSAVAQKEINFIDRLHLTSIVVVLKHGGNVSTDENFSIPR